MTKDNGFDKLLQLGGNVAQFLVDQARNPSLPLRSREVLYNKALEIEKQLMEVSGITSTEQPTEEPKNDN